MTATISVFGRALESKRIPGPNPCLVFLHEGLGSVSLWRDFPDRVAEACGLGAFVYSRAGYGASDPASLPRPVRFMHDEAYEVLPEVLRVAGIRDFFLLGHSDGASIALLYAARFPSPGLRGIVAMAPHVLVEDLSIRSIEAARVAYEEGDLRGRLAKHHGPNVDCAFRGWNDVWLSPEFRAWNLEAEMASVTCPVLLLQGRDDAYGTPAQLERIAARVRGPTEVALFDACGHSPHRDQPDRALAAIASFAQRITHTV